ncbi:hypothetical protein HMPREF3034_02354 [Prevotella sp. DNF00663]|nr:hypothetical protein HMPREF3034_02354 [Prevotella sp. DNF00663]
MKHNNNINFKNYEKEETKAIHVATMYNYQLGQRAYAYEWKRP